ncbi:ATP-dependent RNA helicase SUV3 [Aspergillus lucknowensis]|uniref:RNA helicase n=1 Tax=Aspergillus lucknowensis TaxID=176173 RepID=A0ABR4LA40_9EURO
MQPWTGQGNQRLFHVLQAPLCLRTRTFTTTSALQRTRPAKKSELVERRKNKQQPVTNHNFESVPRSMRKRLATTEFPGIVTTTLRGLKEDYTPRGPDDAESWAKFERFVLNACKADDRRSRDNLGSLLQLKGTLQTAFLKHGIAGLRSELEFLQYSHHLSAQYSEPNLQQQKKVADLRYPAEWYPQARATQRTIHLHVGPTNSGKTYHALKRLEASKNGFYAGPLRLLAQEVYHRFQSSGIPCSLVTGDDVKFPEGQTSVIVSKTVEMVDLGHTYDVGVIDEIQMIADPKRGWAWTRALLGSRVTELHLCGESRVVPLIRELAALTGDLLEIHRYERLNPLKAMNQSLKGDLTKLEKGDCVVSFSRLGIHALKASIEKTTGRRAAIVYGGLPAEIRTQQASLFNDPDNDYDFLVASDAIGMGLNLSCKRIIFETLVKRVPSGLTRLTVPQIKQIAGRAGRYRSAAQHNNGGNHSQNDRSNVGYVTSMEEVDLPYIRQALGVEPPPLTAAGIIPPDSVFEKFAAYFPQNVSLEYLVKRLCEVSQVHPLFFMCDPDAQVENAEVIDSVSGLRIADQLTFMAAPIHSRDVSGREIAIAFAQCVAEHTNGRLLDIPDLNLEILEEPVSGNKTYLHELEALHRSVILYTWLSFRFGGVFTDRTLAFHVKELVEERMVRALTEFSENKKLRKSASLHRQIALQKQSLERKQLLSEAEALGLSEDLNDSEETSASVELGTSDGFDTSENEEPTETDSADDNDYGAAPEPRADGNEYGAPPEPRAYGENPFAIQR